MPVKCPWRIWANKSRELLMTDDTTTRHDDVIKRKHFPRYWPFVRGFHRPPVNSPHKGQWRGAFIFSLICAWIDGWVNNREASDLRRHRAHYDVTVMNTKHICLHILWDILYNCTCSSTDRSCYKLRISSDYCNNFLFEIFTLKTIVKWTNFNPFQVTPFNHLGNLTHFKP